MNKIIGVIVCLKKLNYVLTKEQKCRTMIVLIIAIFGAFLELFGVTAILPFVQLIVSPELVENNEVFIFLYGIFGYHDQKSLLVLIGLGILCLYLFKNAYMIFASYAQYALSSRIQMEMSTSMLDAYLGHTYEYFLDVNSADIIRGCSADVDGVYTILNNLMQAIKEILTMVLIASFLVYSDPIIALSVVGMMIMVLAVMLVIFKPIMKKLGISMREKQRDKNKVLLQTVNGVKEIFVLQRKDLFGNEYRKISDEYRRLVRFWGTMGATPDRIAEGICVGGIMGIVCVRLYFSDAETMMKFIPTLAAFAMAAFKIFPSIGRLTSIYNLLVYHTPCLNNMYSVYKEKELICEQERRYIQDSSYQCRKLDRGVIDDTFKNEIRLVNVKWKYKNQDHYILDGVNLIIKKGQSVGLIGPSGSGKTTISDIILGLLKPLEGQVLVDGVDVYTIPQVWSKIVGYVPQTVFLADDTVRNNIIFGKNESVADDNGIWTALEQAQLADFIRSLPEGLETIVGERGVKFSGGQRQRLVIARALYNSPQILILDEATAALDNETEEAVMEAIEHLQGKITMIIVAHRLTTIRKCDVVYKINGGKAVPECND